MTNKGWYAIKQRNQTIILIELFVEYLLCSSVIHAKNWDSMLWIFWLLLFIE